MADPRTNTVFQQAFIEWRDSILLKKKSHKSRFLLSCNNAILESKDSASPESIMEGIAIIESKSSQKLGARTTKKILGPVVSILKDYYGVIDTCCKAASVLVHDMTITKIFEGQADPFPTAIIWGSLKVIIDVRRFSINLLVSSKADFHLRVLADTSNFLTRFDHSFIC
jgi:hypothetical protein